MINKSFALVGLILLANTFQANAMETNAMKINLRNAAKEMEESVKSTRYAKEHHQAMLKNGMQTAGSAALALTTLLIMKKHGAKLGYRVITLAAPTMLTYTYGAETLKNLDKRNIFSRIAYAQRARANEIISHIETHEESVCSPKC